MNTPFDLKAAARGDDVCLRDGTVVHVFATNMKGGRPVTGSFMRDGREICVSWLRSGAYYADSQSEFDLVMAP